MLDRPRRAYHKRTSATHTTEAITDDDSDEESLPPPNVSNVLQSDKAPVSKVCSDHSVRSIAEPCNTTGCDVHITSISFPSNSTAQEDVHVVAPVSRAAACVKQVADETFCLSQSHINQELNKWATPGEASSTSQLSWESITDDAVCMFGFNFGSLQTARNRAQKFMIDFSDIDRLKKPACRDYHNCDYYANDNIVNLLLDTVHASHETRTSVIPLSSFAFEKFVSEDCKHTATKNLLREVNRRQACGKSLFVPINNRNHWCAASISNLNGRTQVRIYNSLQQAWAPDTQKHILAFASATFNKDPIQLSFASVAKQVNGFDCGLHMVLAYACVAKAGVLRLQSRDIVQATSPKKADALRMLTHSMLVFVVESIQCKSAPQ